MINDKLNLGHNLTAIIAKDMGFKIVSGVYAVDEILPSEKYLYEQYNVSRTIMREALKQLSGKGLLNSRPKRGTIILPEYSWNVFDKHILTWMMESDKYLLLLKDITNIRLSIEPLAAQLAAQYANTEDKKSLGNAIKGMYSKTNYFKEALNSDVNFHLALLKASNNRFLYSMCDIIEITLRFSIKLSNKDKNLLMADAKSHDTVYQAILKGDEQAASNAMREIILEVQKFMHFDEK